MTTNKSQKSQKNEYVIVSHLYHMEFLKINKYLFTCKIAKNNKRQRKNRKFSLSRKFHLLYKFIKFRWESFLSFENWTKKMSKIEKPFSNLDRKCSLFPPYHKNKVKNRYNMMIDGNKITNKK